MDMTLEDRPLRLLSIITGVVFLAELGIMFVLPEFVGGSRLLAGLIDAVLLSGIMFSVLYRFVFQPLITKTNDLKKFKLALDNSSDQVVITDPEGIVIYANPAVEKITGYKPEEAIGKKSGSLWKTPMPTEYYKDLWHTIKEEKKTFTSEIQNKRKNGELYTAVISISPVFGNDGSLLFFVGIERDVTKEREVDKAKSEFISLASHQMRTPLTAVNWYSEMILDEDAGKLTKKQKEYFQEIYEAGRKMNDIIKSFLHILRLESGTIVTNPVPVDLREVLKATLSESKLDIERKKLKIVERYQEQLPPFKSDADLVHVILQNLVSNAVKYTPEKGEVAISLEKTTAGSVVYGKTATEDSVVVRVQDTGIGIREADHEKIFTKFFRTESARRWDPNGNGIGLYMTYKMVTFIGGTIWFDSKEGQGTTFYVLLPLDGKK